MVSSFIDVIDVLVNFLKYRGSVLFPGIVVSAFMDFLLYFCQDFSCLMIWSRFWYLCSSSIVTLSGADKIFFQLLLLNEACFVEGHIGYNLD